MSGTDLYWQKACPSNRFLFQLEPPRPGSNRDDLVVAPASVRSEFVGT